MNETTVIFEFDQKTNENSVFAIHLHKRVGPEGLAYLRKAWEQAWEGLPTPRLMVFEIGMSLSAVTDDELRAAGLMRITGDSPPNP